MDVVDSIAAVQTDENDKPVEDGMAGIVGFSLEGLFQGEKCGMIQAI